MDRPTCGTCKHWGNTSDYLDGKNGLRACQAIPFNESDEAPKTLAVVNDGSDFNGCLRSKEDFGCVLWVDKESNA